MNTTVFSENMKKFRLAKKYTQEDVAENGQGGGHRRRPRPPLSEIAG